jgi:hypothetical protein
LDGRFPAVLKENPEGIFGRKICRDEWGPTRDKPVGWGKRDTHNLVGKLFEKKLAEGSVI